MKLLKQVEGVWYLVTREGASQAVRRINQSARPLGATDKARVLQSPAREWDTRYLWRPGDPDQISATSIPVTRLDAWREIAHELQTSPGTYNPPIRPSVPHTPLRDLCRELRSLRDVHPRFQKLWAEQPQLLARRFLGSVEAFEEYVNDEPFLPPNRSGKSLVGSTSFAPEIVRRMHAASQLTINDETFFFAGYEVSPRRTTNATRNAEEHTNSSGMGGIDALLTNRNGLTVVEIKSADDTTLLLALVQGLMYAAELVSESQRRRLARYGATDANGKHPLGFLESAEVPFIDIMLLAESESRHMHDSEAIHHIARQLLHGDHGEASMVRQHLRSIRLVTAKLEGDGFACQSIWQSSGQEATRSDTLQSIQ